MLEREYESAQNVSSWRTCSRNPGHEETVSAQDFLKNRVFFLQTGKQRAVLRAVLDLTVRVRVYYRSKDRPDDIEIPKGTGAGSPHLGTGYLCSFSLPVCNKRCPCDQCQGKIKRTYWTFRVRTAHHVVYNTKEAKNTKVDLFFDDESCWQDGRMKTVKGLKAIWIVPERDVCEFLCATHDETLVKRIKRASQQFTNAISCQDIDKDCYTALVVDHPHGQSKKITSIKLNDELKCDTSRCLGSSGASTLVFGPKIRYVRSFTYVKETQTLAKRHFSISSLEKLPPSCLAY